LVAQEVTNATNAKNNEMLMGFFKEILRILLVIANQEYDFLTLGNWTEFLLIGSKG
jgi:hypothetical protein